MTGFRGSDDVLDHEIETLEGMARLRLRRVAREMRDLDRELKQLRAERARRRARAAGELPSPVEADVPLGTAEG